LTYNSHITQLILIKYRIQRLLKKHIHNFSINTTARLYQFKKKPLPFSTCFSSSQFWGTTRVLPSAHFNLPVLNTLYMVVWNCYLLIILMFTMFTCMVHFSHFLYVIDTGFHSIVIGELLCDMYSFEVQRGLLFHLAYDLFWTMFQTYLRRVCILLIWGSVF
jgi:hypothetical protein